MHCPWKAVWVDPSVTRDTKEAIPTRCVPFSSLSPSKACPPFQPRKRSGCASRVCAVTEKCTRISVKQFDEQFCDSLVMPELHVKFSRALSLLRVVMYTTKLLQVVNLRIIAAAICKIYATVISLIYKKRRIYMKTSFRRAREFRNEDFARIRERERERIPIVTVKLASREHELGVSLNFNHIYISKCYSRI